jgi:hypothetical protein
MPNIKSIINVGILCVTNICWTIYTKETLMGWNYLSKLLAGQVIIKANSGKKVGKEIRANMAYA